MATDLYSLLTTAGIAPPYVLVGHSIGGIVARRFYAKHPDLVAGMLLVDSSHEQQAQRFAALDRRRGAVMYPGWQCAVRPGFWACAGSPPRWAWCGVRRRIAREAPLSTPGNRAILLSSRHRRVAVREMLMMARMRGEPPALGSIPLTVLTREGPGGIGCVGTDAGRARRLSTDSLHISAERGGHYLNLDEPDLSSRRSVIWSGAAARASAADYAYEPLSLAMYAARSSGEIRRSFPIFTDDSLPE